MGPFHRPFAVKGGCKRSITKQWFNTYKECKVDGNSDWGPRVASKPLLKSICKPFEEVDNMKFFFDGTANLYTRHSQQATNNKMWAHTMSLTSECAYRQDDLIFIRSTLYALPSKYFLLIPELERSHFSRCNSFSLMSVVGAKGLTRMIAPGPVFKSFPKAQYRDNQGDMMTSLAW